MFHPTEDPESPPRAYTRRAPSAPPAFVLSERLRTSVAVIGAGFTGLSAALHLAEAGVDATVLEAREIGWGASGRAFGQVVPYLKHDHQDIVLHYGAERGERVIDAVASGPRRVADLVERLGIECDLRRSGLIFAAHAPSGERTLAARVAYWQDRGVAVEMLDQAATRAAVGSSAYRAAVLEHRGVHLNPFAYARGLAAAAVKAGARICEAAPARSLNRVNGRWEIAAGPHMVTADAVIIATNAYTGDLWPGLAQSVIPMRGYGAVSAPLSDNVRRSILPGGQALTDTRKLHSGVRILADGRLHASLNGPAFGKQATPYIGPLDVRMARLFPQLGRVAWEETWSGFIAVTPDQFPRVHRLGPNLFAGLGYSGRGIAAATMIGAELAARARGVPDADLVFPESDLRRIGWHRFAAVPVGALLRWWRLREAIGDMRLLSPRP